MPSTPPSDRPALGRPAAIDAQDLARVAIGLFAERGYDAVSMADIAEAAGVGRRSLFRYFPSKADLVWGGADVVGAELERLLARARATGRWGTRTPTHSSPRSARASPTWA